MQQSVDKEKSDELRKSEVKLFEFFLGLGEIYENFSRSFREREGEDVRGFVYLSINPI